MVSNAYQRYFLIIMQRLSVFVIYIYCTVSIITLVQTNVLYVLMTSSHFDTRMAVLTYRSNWSRCHTNRERLSCIPDPVCRPRVFYTDKMICDKIDWLTSVPVSGMDLREFVQTKKQAVAWLQVLFPNKANNEQS